MGEDYFSGCAGIAEEIDGPLTSGRWIWAVGEKLPAKQVGLLPTHTVELIQPEVT